MSHRLTQPAKTLVKKSKRSISDLVIKHTTGRPIIGSGPGGRHSVTGHVATVFGCTGQLGRYIVAKLARQGTQVVVPYRDADEARFLKPMGDLGQIVPMEWSLKNEAQIEECLRHSDIVYNCIGRNYETRNFEFADVLVDGPRRLAHIARESGVSRFVHISHISADFGSSSAFLRAKASGETSVRDAFPGATIVRPSWLFGPEDDLLNTLALHPILFRINKQRTKFAPVWVIDVAEACKVIMDAESTVGEIISLPGTKVYTLEEFIALGELAVLKPLQGFNVPKWVITTAAKLWQYLWFPTISPDYIKRRFEDEKLAEPGTLGFKDLGIEPESLENLIVNYLRLYRTAEDYNRVIEKGGDNVLQRRPYRVIY